jgi:uncharacterized membrane protein YphA (DoxX/SURF4 family)
MILTLLQIIAALTIYNVWFIRAGKPSPYRGKGAGSLKKEFLAYGLPVWFMYLVGTIKVLSATALIVGIWYPYFVGPAALVLFLMMVGAVLMHIKVRDSFKRALPSLVMLLISLVIFISY